MSDLDIILRELNIQPKNINLDDLYVQIEEKQNNNSQCVFKSVVNGAFNNIIQTIKSDNMEDDNISLCAKQMMCDFKMSKKQYYTFLDMNNDFDNYLKYNVCLSEDKKIKENCVDRSIERYNNCPNYVKQYTNKKFRQLEDFCNTHLRNNQD